MLQGLYKIVLNAEGARITEVDTGFSALDTHTHTNTHMHAHTHARTHTCAHTDADRQKHTHKQTNKLMSLNIYASATKCCV